LLQRPQDTEGGYVESFPSTGACCASQSPCMVVPPPSPRCCPPLTPGCIPFHPFLSPPLPNLILGNACGKDTAGMFSADALQSLWTFLFCVEVQSAMGSLLGAPFSWNVNPPRSPPTPISKSQQRQLGLPDRWVGRGSCLQTQPMDSRCCIARSLG